MGCDIHLYAEKKKPKTFWGRLLFRKAFRWETIDKWSMDFDCDPPVITVLREDMIYTHGRNYNLFAALCGVRSGNFLNPENPISKPRGVPDDCCAEYKKKVEYYGSDGHSHSYNTLRELEQYDWTPWGETCNDFLSEVLPKLRKHSVTGDDVRITYFFDN